MKTVPDLDKRWSMTVAVLRELRGWTQKELADRAGLAQSLISMIECGQRSSATALNTFQQIASAFDFMPSELMYIMEKTLQGEKKSDIT